MKDIRRKMTSEFKAKVALAAIREDETVPQIAHRYGIHPSQVYAWKKQVLSNLAEVFTDGRKRPEPSEEKEKLMAKIGELTMERDFLSRGLERLR